MIPIELKPDSGMGMTLLSNAFIDNYMKYANDVQIKVYLYLLRHLSAGLPVDLSSMADAFNYSEKDIMRALLFWERWGVLRLVCDAAERAVGDDYDDYGTHLTGIRFISLPDTPPARTSAIFPLPASDMAASSDAPVATTVPATSPDTVKSAYTLDDMRLFRKDERYAYLFTAAQQYLGRPLTEPQLRTLLYITRELRFAPELSDYLLQYCIGNDHKSFHYIEATAIAWAEQGITTIAQAREAARRDTADARIAQIMGYLGRSGAPAPQEARFIRRWLHDYAFPMPVIEEACSRTVAAVENHRFAYAESILKKWHESGVILSR